MQSSRNSLDRYLSSVMFVDCVMRCSLISAFDALTHPAPALSFTCPLAASLDVGRAVGATVAFVPSSSMSKLMDSLSLEAVLEALSLGFNRVFTSSASTAWAAASAKVRSCAPPSSPTVAILARRRMTLALSFRFTALSIFRSL